ncbi:zinc-finger domain-containing protein [Bacillus solimangrovi]|uniref:Zinc-finger domain-containing protein n=1 Tax=Bacillus solimangrovi TaxID=1305675 RepID=A0A1E5LFI0_9BACI|nr:zinc-finger domain-containing protein [Bacillus solimangrovi]OEH92848.1 zinc-finger domain-containing protein [Bacillus solimangrovi]
MQRKKIIIEVTELIDTYCTDCFLKAHHIKEHGKKQALSFCIKECTVGEKIQSYGKKLS